MSELEWELIWCLRIRLESKKSRIASEPTNLLLASALELALAFTDRTSIPNKSRRWWGSSYSNWASYTNDWGI